MADLKISQLPVFTSAVPATDAFAVVSGGTTKQITTNQILGSSGVATLASATITGALTVDTSTLKVDSANHRVIIGHTSGSSAFQVSNAGGAGLEVQPTGVNSAPVILSYNRSGSAYTQLTIDAANFLYNISGSTGMILNSTSNLVLKGGTAGANGVGVTFPATQVASSDANCLDDYEEGPWVPTITGQVNCTAVTSVSAQYTKVGRLVTLSGYATANVTTANLVTYFTLGSLPFTAAALTVGSLMENATYKLGTSQVSGTTLYGIFSAVAQLTTGAQDFYYSITYSV